MSVLDAPLSADEEGGIFRDPPSEDEGESSSKPLENIYPVSVN